VVFKNTKNRHYNGGNGLEPEIKPKQRIKTADKQGKREKPIVGRLFTKLLQRLFLSMKQLFCIILLSGFYILITQQQATKRGM
jgi:hypothetical protein